MAGGSCGLHSSYPPAGPHVNEPIKDDDFGIDVLISGNGRHPAKNAGKNTSSHLIREGQYVPNK